MLSTEDINVWEKFKQSVFRLNFGRKTEELPPRLKVRRAAPRPLSYCLDLHKMTLEEAYQQTVHFIKKHYETGSKHIQIITGKGRNGQGAIHLEFMGWLDTKSLTPYIREIKWAHDKGAVEIWLKKNKSF